MCGIAGILRFDGAPIATERVARMTDSLVHRGPNGSGTLFGAADGVSWGLGHRRLSIIDLAGGAQPMSTPDGTATVVFNGEIYNYRELAAELQARGRALSSRSDTEALLHALDEWGIAAVDRLRGMFAFAFIDTRRQQFVLARDATGIKPLVVHRTPQALVFASELPALVAGLDVPPTGSLAAVDAYLKFGYIPPPFTIYHEVRELDPASVLVVDFAGKVNARRYRSFAFNQPLEGAVPRSDEGWVRLVSDTVTEAVTAQLVADVPVAAFLSGGIDSTLVVNEMARHVGGQVTAYSIGFEEPELNELPWAERAAKAIGVRLVTEMVRETALAGLPAIVEACGQPFGDSSIVPTWHVSRLAARDVRVALSGDGGDEGFAGYGSYPYFLDQVERPHPAELVARVHHEGWRAALRQCYHAMHGDTGWLDAWWTAASVTNDGDRNNLWHADARPTSDAPRRRYADVAGPEHGDPLAWAQGLDLQMYLPGDILRKVDIASMAHGLEVRPPLLDDRVLHVAQRIPRHLRVGRGRVGKAVLKEVLRRRVPALGEDFIGRRKTGFALPRSLWMSAGHLGQQQLLDILAGETPLKDWFRAAVIRGLLHRHAAGDDTSGPLWLLLVLGLWLQRHPGLSFT